jgi:hypothetical protein
LITCWLGSGARAARRVREHRGNREPLAHEDAHRVRPEDARGGLLLHGGIQARHILDLAPAHHLPEQRVDEVQVADKADAGLGEHLAREFARRARGARGPLEAEALAAVVKQPLNAELGHRATIP